MGGIFVVTFCASKESFWQFQYLATFHMNVCELGIILGVMINIKVITINLHEMVYVCVHMYVWVYLYKCTHTINYVLWLKIMGNSSFFFYVLNFNNLCIVAYLKQIYTIKQRAQKEIQELSSRTNKEERPQHTKLNSSMVYIINNF